jgi:MOSC domain-containing protein YiiM
MITGIFIKTPPEHGLPKTEVAKAKILKEGLEGDFNRFRHERKNDDPDRAVLIITEDLLVKFGKAGYPVKPGDLGENILLSGITYNELASGMRLWINDVVLEITKQCTPCRNIFALSYATVDFIKLLKGQRGIFARVIREGTVEKGNKVEFANLCDYQ